MVHHDKVIIYIDFGSAFLRGEKCPQCKDSSENHNQCCIEWYNDRVEEDERRAEGLIAHLKKANNVKTRYLLVMHVCSFCSCTVPTFCYF